MVKENILAQRKNSGKRLTKGRISWGLERGKHVDGHEKDLNKLGESFKGEGLDSAWQCG